MLEGTLVAQGSRVICPRCGTRYAINAEFYGRTFPCEQCQEDVLVPEYRERVDGRPILRRGEGVVWAKIEQERDRIYEALSKACEKYDLEAHVLRSSPYDYPSTVTLECWLPRGNPLVTERSLAVVTIRPEPFRTYDVLSDVRIQRCRGLGALEPSRAPGHFPFRPWFFLLCILLPPLLLLPIFYVGYRLVGSGGGKIRSFTALRELPEQDLEGLVAHLLGKGWCPYLSKYSVRRHWWQFWRPKNKIEALMPDWLALLDVALVVAAISAFGLARQSLQYQKFSPIAYLLLAGAAGLWIFLKLRPRLVRSSGKPEHEPRALERGDGWHVVLFDVGAEAPGLKAEFEQSLKEAGHEKMKYHTEQIWYRGLDDIEQREQMVLQFGRAMVYCQIYRYQDDLYVGWDAFLNQAQWDEEAQGKGLDRECGLPVTIAVTVPGYQETTEYDEADLHLASAWIHARLSKLVRRLMKDKSIDQEIDFRPVHQDRAPAGSQPGQRALGAPGSLPARFMALFRRKA